MKHYFQCILAGLILFAFMNECVAAGKIISPEMSILFRIVDDAGNPVPNVSCRGWIRQFDAKGGGRSYSLTSDANGVVAINAKCSVSFTAFFSKEGYYMSRLEPCLDADGAGSAVVDGKWQPYASLVGIPMPLRAASFGTKSGVRRLLLAIMLQIGGRLP